MPLSKKYYQMIADVLKGVSEDFVADENLKSGTYAPSDKVLAERQALILEIARRLGDQFNADNPRFDFSRWEKWIFNQFPHIKERS